MKTTSLPYQHLKDVVTLPPSILLTLFTILSLGILSPNATAQNYMATYSISVDYSTSDMSLLMKKKFAAVTSQNKEIYKMLISPSSSYEWTDSIAHTCGSNDYGVEPKIIMRKSTAPSLTIAYKKGKKLKCFEVTTPQYTDDWKIQKHISSKNSSVDYMIASDPKSKDYVIFSPTYPTPFNIKLLDKIPGIVVEAQLGELKIELLDIDIVEANFVEEKMQSIHKYECAEVENIDQIKPANFLSLSDYMSNQQFECVEKL